MMNKSFGKVGSVLATVMVLSAPAVHAESPHEFSANVALSTDYRFRGISQTNEDPAISGGFDYSNSAYGAYAGVWASNLEFGLGAPDNASIEIDYYAGLAGEILNGIGWDVGGLYYYYPGVDNGPGGVDFDYFEVYGSLSYDFGMFDVTGGLNYSPDYFAETDTFFYYYGDVGVPLNFMGLSLSAHVGYSDIDDEVGFGAPSYTDYSIGLSKDIGAFTFDLSYIDTDLDDTECFGGTDLCDATALFTVSSSF